MAAGGFFTDEAKRRVTTAIKEIESQTSAEIIVVVRRVSGRYRHADYLAGSIAAFTMLLAVLFHPKAVRVEAIPIDVALAFAAGAIFTAYFDPVRRLLAGARTMEEHVRTAAGAAFVERGVSRTRGRSGVLVYVGAFERRVEVVRDIGVDPSTAKDAWERAVRALGDSLREGGDLESFIGALGALGPALAPDLPRREDDENELPDVPVTE